MGLESGPRRPFETGDRLPRLEFSRIGGGTVRLRDPARGATVVAYVDAANDSSAREYIAALAAAEEEFRLWYGRAVVIVGSDPGDAAAEAIAGRVGVPVATDPESGLRRRLGVRDGESALFVADRWGQLYGVWHERLVHELPGPDEAVQWLRYLATQCPECGVPDEPGPGEWGA